ncbi:putative holocarboxylase synthetase [Oryza sativa Japonica Group]|jgi:hypothetical protein|uniref:Os01g0589500 protein n=5 Tax=Oryza TaxID=4527 RepID=Q8S268_ORYSJ|nr:uncharacterized protein LOC4324451 [Oryza sativa Japonica Group]KAB8082061.1 hypothetical protein EE612_003798 [Oryza sativa]KAF2950958.1 hypothetical protein DAI22_01g226100 [Oryza sativa Japonica Group]BAB89033.1 putative holocarboxylase synthetase [Oryza sativa Japonica Group]BAC78568.1 hypothetical protein [Oryza sativa Japonica Group]BAG88159.1 unnamed protein product [Oryza sativa Japonica Group]
MARKRKTDAAPRLDEADRTLYSTFCGAANSLSQLYTQAMAQQKLSFQAGERHSLEKLHQWILRKHEEESRLTAADIMSHIQHELDYGGNDPHVSPRVHQHSANPFANSSIQPSAGSYGQATVGFAPRPSISDQSKNTIFSNALSSPVRRSLQSYHLTQGSGNGGRNAETNSAGQNRETNSGGSNDTSMDMVSDSAGNEYY